MINARHMRNVPGRKTDVADAVWGASLLEHGLVRPSFIPPEPFRALRDLCRYRKAVIEERARESQRLHKVLEDALLTELREEKGCSGGPAPDWVVTVPARDRARSCRARPVEADGRPAWRTTADPFEPFQLVDETGTIVEAVSDRGDNGARVFCFAVTATDPNAVCRARVGHEWVDLDDSAGFPSAARSHLIELSIWPPTPTPVRSSFAQPDTNRHVT